MAIDPSIALQVKPIQIESPVNMLSQALQVQGLARQNDLANAQAEQTKMGIARQNALMQHLSNPANDITSDQGQAQLLQRFPDLGPKIVESLQGIAKTKAETAKNNAQASSAEAEATNKAMDAQRGMLTMVRTPEQFATWVDGMYTNPATAKVAAQFGKPEDIKARIPTDPAQFQKFLEQNAVGMDKFMQNQTTMRGQDITRQNSLDTNATRIKTTAMANATSRANNQATIQKDLTIADPMGTFGINPSRPQAAPGASAPGAGAASGDAFLASVPKQIGDQVKALAEGRMAFPTGQALKSPYWQSMLSAVAQYDPSFDAVNYNARAKTRQDFTSGKSAQAVNAFNTVLGHIGNLEEAGKALNNSSVPLWNTVTNSVIDATGDPRVKNYNLAKDAVVGELVKAFNNGHISDSQLKEWSASVKDANSPEQMAAVNKQLVSLLGSKINAMKEQYTAGMGTTSQTMPLLKPHAKAVFDRVMGPSSEGSSATYGWKYIGPVK